jgi:hypothetical protein
MGHAGWNLAGAKRLANELCHHRGIIDIIKHTQESQRAAIIQITF